MSLLNDISAVVGTRSATGGAGQQPTLAAGQQPGGPSAAQQVTARFGSAFQTTFRSTMATVYERGASGEFDDRTLALEEQAALQRLRIAQQAAGVQPTATTGVPQGAGGSGDGANAAPDPGAATAGTVTGGGGTDATTSMVALAEQRQLYGVRVRQSEARLQNISASLQRDFPKASQLASASSGTWDPATFVPKTKDEAEAFAQRMVIDATEAAARLEILKTQLDAARFEQAQGGGAQVTKLVQDLEAAYDRQKGYVDKLASIVDRQSGGMMTDAGTDALAGRTMRGADDLPVGEIAAALRAEGFSEAQIKRVVGAGEAAVEQEKTPGGSTRLKEMVTKMVAFSEQLRQSSEADRKRWAEEDRKREEHRIEEKQRDRRRTEDRHFDEAGEQRRTEQAAQERAAAERNAQQQASFEQWIQQLAAQHRRQQRAG